jgi:hypothetical protein
MNYDTLGIADFLGQTLRFGFLIYLMFVIFNGFGYIKDVFFTSDRSLR